MYPYCCPADTLIHFGEARRCMCIERKRREWETRGVSAVSSPALLEQSTLSHASSRKVDENPAANSSRGNFHWLHLSDGLGFPSRPRDRPASPNTRQALFSSRCSPSRDCPASTDTHRSCLPPFRRDDVKTILTSELNDMVWRQKYFMSERNDMVWRHMSCVGQERTCEKALTS